MIGPGGAVGRGVEQIETDAPAVAVTMCVAAVGCAVPLKKRQKRLAAFRSHEFQ